MRANWTAYANSASHNTAGFICHPKQSSLIVLSCSTNNTLFLWSCSIWSAFILVLIMYLRGLLYFSALPSFGLLLLSLLLPVLTIMPKKRPKRVVAQIARTLCLLLLGMFRKIVDLTVYLSSNALSGTLW